MIREAERLLGREALGDAVQRVCDAVHPTRTVIGWGTVDLDRAVADLAAALGPDGRVDAWPAPDDALLGARARLVRPVDGRGMVLLEPSTEGLLAASLARFGEGSVALYLVVGAEAYGDVRRAGFTLSAEASGPFGRQRRVVVGPRWGPHLVVATSADRPRAATIGR